MATSVPFGRRQPKPVTPPSPPSGGGMIPPELDTDPRKNINPKTQTGPRMSAMLRKRSTSSASGGRYG